MICLSLSHKTRAESGIELPKVHICSLPTSCFTKHGECSVVLQECPLAKLVMCFMKQAEALATASSSVDCQWKYQMVSCFFLPVNVINFVQEASLPPSLLAETFGKKSSMTPVVRGSQELYFHIKIARIAENCIWIKSF